MPIKSPAKLIKSVAYPLFKSQNPSGTPYKISPNMSLLGKKFNAPVGMLSSTITSSPSSSWTELISLILEIQIARPMAPFFVAGMLNVSVSPGSSIYRASILGLGSLCPFHALNSNEKRSAWLNTFLPRTEEEEYRLIVFCWAHMIFPRDWIGCCEESRVRKKYSSNSTNSPI